MKYSIIILFALMAFCTPEAINAQPKEKDQFSVQVDGLGCPFCAYGLEKKFKELKGVKNVRINMETGLFTFSFPTEQKLSIERVEKQVELAGYTPVSMEIKRADGTTEVSAPADEGIEYGTLTEASFWVNGVCGMCRARIERTASKIAGVKDPKWNKKTKMLEFKFDAQYTSKEEVAKAIADAGHDTKNTQAPDQVYEDLPACCHYDRIQ